MSRFSRSRAPTEVDLLEKRENIIDNIRKDIRMVVSSIQDVSYFFQDDEDMSAEKIPQKLRLWYYKLSKVIEQVYKRKENDPPTTAETAAKHLASGEVTKIILGFGDVLSMNIFKEKYEKARHELLDRFATLVSDIFGKVINPDNYSPFSTEYSDVKAPSSVYLTLGSEIGEAISVPMVICDLIDPFLSLHDLLAYYRCLVVKKEKFDRDIQELDEKMAEIEKKKKEEEERKKREEEERMRREEEERKRREEEQRNMASEFAKTLPLARVDPFRSRQANISPLSQLDQSADVERTITQYKNMLKRTQDELTASRKEARGHNDTIERLKKIIRDLEREIEVLKAEIKVLGEKAAGHRTDLEDLRRHYKEKIRKLKDEVNEWKREYELIKEQLTARNNSPELQKQIDDLIRERDELKEKCGNLEASLANEQKKSAELEVSLERTRKAYESLENEYDDYKKNRYAYIETAMNSFVSYVHERCNTLATDMEEFHRNMDQIKQLMDIVDRGQKELGTNEQNRKLVNEEIPEHEKCLSICQESLDLELSKLMRLDQKAADFEQQKQKCQDILRSFEFIQSKIASAKQRLSYINDNKQRLEKDNTDLIDDLEKRTKEHEHKLAAKKRECEELTRQVEALQIEHSENIKLRDEIEKLRNAKNHLADQLHFATTEVTKQLRDLKLQCHAYAHPKS